MKKFLIISITLMILLVGGGGYLLIYSTVPSKALSFFLKRTGVLQGSVTGSLNNGFESTDWMIKGAESEIGIKKITFRYSGLYDLFIKKELIIPEFLISGITVKAPPATKDVNLKDSKVEVKAVKTTSSGGLKLFRIENLVIDGCDFSVPLSTFSKSGPFQMVKNSVPSASPQSASAEQTTFQLDNFTIQNCSFLNPVTNNSFNVSKFMLKSYVSTPEKTQFKRLDFDTNMFDLTIKHTISSLLQSGEDKPVHQIYGSLNQNYFKRLKGVAELNGEYESSSDFMIQALQEKIKIGPFGKKKENGKRSVALKINNLTLADHFNNITPITKLNLFLNLPYHPTDAKEQVGSFNLGTSKFNIVGSSFGGPSPSGKKVLMTGVHSKWPQLKAHIGTDSKSPGYLTVEFEGASEPNKRKRLSSIWFNRPYAKLTKTQRSQLESILKYF